MAQGNLANAEELYAWASEAAEQEQDEVSITGLRGLDWQQQIAADVMLGAAQTAVAKQAWTQAEEMLSKVLRLCPS